jgi:hypothetical protein
MEKNKAFTLAVMGIVTIVMLLMLKSLIIEPTARVTELPEEEFISIAPDDVEIQKSDLKYCCEIKFEDSTRGCWVMKKYDCSYCEDYCD